MAACITGAPSWPPVVVCLALGTKPVANRPTQLRRWRDSTRLAGCAVPHLHLMSSVLQRPAAHPWI
jgi:hypothetical protein